MNGQVACFECGLENNEYVWTDAARRDAFFVLLGERRIYLISETK